MTNAEIRNKARQMVKDGQAESMVKATHLILAEINAHANAYYRANLPVGDR